MCVCVCVSQLLIMEPRLGPHTNGEGVQAKRIKSNVLLDQGDAVGYWEDKQDNVGAIMEKRDKAGRHQRRMAEMMDRLKRDKMGKLKRELAQWGTCDCAVVRLCDCAIVCACGWVGRWRVHVSAGCGPAGMFPFSTCRFSTPCVPYLV